MSPKRRYPHPLIYEQLVAERLFDPLEDKEPPVARHADYDGNGIRDDLEGDPPTHSADPPAGHDYVYTDPVADPDWPHITDPDDDDCPDCFPDTWGAAPTERDQAAIDAGNA